MASLANLLTWRNVEMNAGWELGLLAWDCFGTGVSSAGRGTGRSSVGGVEAQGEAPVDQLLVEAQGEAVLEGQLLVEVRGPTAGRGSGRSSGKGPTAGRGSERSSGGGPTAGTGSAGSSGGPTARRGSGRGTGPTAGKGSRGLGRR